MDLPKIAFRHIDHEWIQVTTVSLAMDQMLGTALLLLIILAVTDEENMKITSSLVPVIIGLGLSAIHLRLVSGLGWTHISQTYPMVATQSIFRIFYFQLWLERWLSNQPCQGLLAKASQLPRGVE